MDNDNIIQAYNEDNELEEIEVFEFIHLDEYDREYLVYTKNESVGDDIITYYAILEEIAPGEYHLSRIENEVEARRVMMKFAEDAKNM